MAEKITYYGTPETIYDENVDFVKGTSLTGSEVDMNFNTLEGRGIKKISLDGNNLVVTFINGNEATCSMAGVSAIRSLAFEYDREHGTLLVFVNGHEHPIPIEGFISENEFREFKELGVLTDGTIVGNGTQSHPLALSPMFRTGMLKPVNSYVESLPETPGTGERYVNAENIDAYGALYSYKGVLNIMEHLEGTGWHVATKEDWDDMLNALEPELADRNHHLHECNEYLGENANYYINDHAHNFNAIMCGFAYNEDSLHVDHNGESAAWWTASHDDDKNAYVKRIDEYADGVYQDIIDGQHYFSVRLVRDIEPDEVAGAEEILGKTYMTVRMPSESKGLRLWIATNYTSDLTPVVSEETETTTTTECNGTTTTTITTITTVLDDMSDAIYRPSVYPESVTVYFVNEWDGNHWVKQMIDFYDAFYVESLGGFYYMTDDGLVSINDATPIDIETRIDKIEGDVDNLSNLYSIHNNDISILQQQVENNTNNIGSIQNSVDIMRDDIAMIQSMSVSATDHATTALNTVMALSDEISQIRNEVDNLMLLHINELAELYVDYAINYNWSGSYNYRGGFEHEGLVINYTIGESEIAANPKVIEQDFDHFFLAVHLISSILALNYDSNNYIWNEGGTVSGYKSRDNKTIGEIMNIVVKSSGLAQNTFAIKMSNLSLTIIIKKNSNK